jgi:hypothetical protein
MVARQEDQARPCVRYLEVVTAVFRAEAPAVRMAEGAGSITDWEDAARVKTGTVCIRSGAKRELALAQGRPLPLTRSQGMIQFARTTRFSQGVSTDAMAAIPSQR